MTRRRQINEMLTFHNQEKLAAVPEVELESFLLAELEDYDLDPTSDSEGLISTGITIAKAGHGNADSFAIQWLLANPSARRLGIASQLLLGLWKGLSPSAAIAPQKIENFMRAREGLALQETEEYDYVLALCQSMEASPPPPLRERIAAVLRETMRRQFTYEPFNTAIGIVVPRALRHN
jgi:hypothetical protein